MCRSCQSGVSCERHPVGHVSVICRSMGQINDRHILPPAYPSGLWEFFTPPPGYERTRKGKRGTWNPGTLWTYHINTCDANCIQRCQLILHEYNDKLNHECYTCLVAPIFQIMNHRQCLMNQTFSTPSWLAYKAILCSLGWILLLLFDSL